MLLLTKDLWFPDPHLADEDGLLAIGGDLSTARLLLAYESGIFPWFMHEGMIFWFCPPERMVLFPDELHISKSMQQLLRSDRFHITTNQAFGRVIQLCAQVHERQQSATWINDDFIHAYNRLHEMGHAVSIECWQQQQLAGGLYGIAVGKVFCGESMFALQPNASKAALIELCKSGKYKVIDCQVETNHLASMGARKISRAAYLKLLNQAHV